MNKGNNYFYSKTSKLNANCCFQESHIFFLKNSKWNITFLTFHYFYFIMIDQSLIKRHVVRANSSWSLHREIESHIIIMDILLYQLYKKKVSKKPLQILNSPGFTFQIKINYVHQGWDSFTIKPQFFHVLLYE